MALLLPTGDRANDTRPPLKVPDLVTVQYSVLLIPVNPFASKVPPALPLVACTVSTGDVPACVVTPNGRYAEAVPTGNA